MYCHPIGMHMDVAYLIWLEAESTSIVGTATIDTTVPFWP
jgi:hypothetical protein